MTYRAFGPLTHLGRHSVAYHQHVLTRLRSATQGLSGQAYNAAFEAELEALRRELLANPALIRGAGL